MTGQPPIPELRGGNPLTQRAHRREVFLQITLPLIFGGVLLLGAAIAVAVLGARGQGDVRKWADVSLIWLILPMMVFALLFMALTAAIAYLFTSLIKALPPFARQIQDFLIVVQDRLTKIADSAVEPVIRTEELSASRRALGTSLRRFFTRRRRR